MSCCKQSGQGCEKKKDQQDYLVCTCMGVMYQEIKQAVHQGADSFEALSEQLGVGTGCSSCVAEVKSILQDNEQSGCCKS